MNIKQKRIYSGPITNTAQLSRTWFRSLPLSRSTRKRFGRSNPILFFTFLIKIFLQNKYTKYRFLVFFGFPQHIDKNFRFKFAFFKIIKSRSFLKFWLLDTFKTPELKFSLKGDLYTCRTRFPNTAGTA